MDSDKRSTQVEGLEVVETGRRRRWSEGEKLKIVMQSLQASSGTRSALGGLLQRKREGSEKLLTSLIYWRKLSNFCQ
jgi:hypothetical protein